MTERPPHSPEPLKILFVCTANICRSAFAEVWARHLLGASTDRAIAVALPFTVAIAIGVFFGHATRPGGHAPFRLLPAAANRQPAYAFYSRWQAPEWRFHSIQLLTLSEGCIQTMTSFVTPALASVFGLPAVLP